MDTLENYRAEILKKNKRHVEEDDPICVLHTFLAKFEADLVASLNAQLQASEARLEGQCDRLEQAEKKRLEKGSFLCQIQRRSAIERTTSKTQRCNQCGII